MRLRIIFVFTILFYHIGIWAGDMSFRHISSGEGLKYTWVWNIFKDSRGYMWFSTTYGAYRYNGYSFEEQPKYSLTLTKVKPNRRLSGTQSGL